MEPKNLCFSQTLSPDKEVYSTARARLKAGIKEVKRRHQERLERDLNTNITKDMWKAIQTSAGYKSRSTHIMCEATLSDELNTFYARIDLLNKVSCQVYSASRGPATVSFHSRCKKNTAVSEYE